MKIKHKSLVALAVVSTVTIAFANVPIRGSSSSGENGQASSWLLLGRTAPVTLTHNTESAVMTMEVVCPQQDVEASRSSPTMTLAGSCDSGEYMFIYQFQSSSTDVNVKITGLVGFVANQDLPNYGVLVCDSKSNTIEKCTTAPDQSLIPDITFTSKSNQVNFLVPNFPDFSAGSKGQGQGLTLFIITQGSTAVPIHFPTVELR